MSRYNLDKFMADRVTIYRTAFTQDKFGGQTGVEEKVGVYVPARIYGTSGMRRVEVDGKVFIPQKKMMVAAEVDVRVGDRIETPIESYKVISIDIKRNESKASHRTAMLVTQDT